MRAGTDRLRSPRVEPAHSCFVCLRQTFRRETDSFIFEARAGIEPAHSCFADSRVTSSPTRPDETLRLYNLDHSDTRLTSLKNRCFLINQIIINICNIHKTIEEVFISISKNPEYKLPEFVKNPNA